VLRPWRLGPERVVFGVVVMLMVALVAAACSTEPVPTSTSDWSRVPHEEAVFGGEGHQLIVSVAAMGPLVVAVGTSGWDGEETPAVWTSPDGITWSRVPHDEAVFGGDANEAMGGVTVGGPGFVAVGSGEVGAAVWTSSDGITWTRVPHDDAVFGNSGMSAVTAGGPGLVAVGDDHVWTSPDGITWTRVADVGEEFNAGAVITGGPGLVMVGTTFSADSEGEEGSLDAIVWTSQDGITWSRVPYDEAIFGDAEMWGVTAGDSGLVAVGRGGFSGDDLDAVVWTSPDGITWSRVANDEAIFGGEGEQAMSSVTADGRGLVAVGWDEASGDNAAVWTSPNGITWSRVPESDAALRADNVQAMMSVTAGGPGIVAVGWTAGEPRDGAVWVEATDG